MEILTYKINTTDLIFTLISNLFGNNEFLFFLLQKGYKDSDFFENAIKDISYKNISLKDLTLKLIKLRLKLIPESIAGEYLKKDERNVFYYIIKNKSLLKYDVFSLNKILKEKMALYRTFLLYQELQSHTDSTNSKDLLKFKSEIEKYYYDINFDMDYNETTLGGENPEEEVLDVVNSLKQGLSSNICTTGFPKFDKLLTRGGIEGGRLLVIGAPPGAGKSTILLHMAIENFKLGKKVMFFTFENSRTETLMRLLSNITDTDITKLFSSFNKTKQQLIEDYLRKYLEIFSNIGGKLLISFYPVNTITPEQLFEDIIKRKASSGKFVPDLIVIDYADLLRPLSYSIGKNRQRTEELKSIYTALKKYSVIWDVPIFTASQLNRGGVKNSKADIDNIAEAFSKIEIADLGLILRENKNKMDNRTQLYVGKARICKAGLTINIIKEPSKFIIKEESVSVSDQYPTNQQTFLNNMNDNIAPEEISTDSEIDF